MRNWKGFMAGFVVALVLTGMVGTAVATSGTRTAELAYSNIKITLDGEEIVPKDANGNTVEPFIIDGTTYLPVRGIGSALGLDVSWDGATSTVLLTTPGKAPVENTNEQKNGIEFINGGIADYIGSPMLGLIVKNTLSENIIRFDLKVSYYDAYGERVDGMYTSLYSDKTIEPGVETEVKWSLLGADGAHKVVFGLYKYVTESGRVVEIPEKEIEFLQVIKK